MKKVLMFVGMAALIALVGCGEKKAPACYIPTDLYNSFRGFLPNAVESIQGALSEGNKFYFRSDGPNEDHAYCLMAIMRKEFKEATPTAIISKKEKDADWIVTLIYNYTEDAMSFNVSTGDRATQGATQTFVTSSYSMRTVQKTDEAQDLKAAQDNMMKRLDDAIDQYKKTH